MGNIGQSRLNIGVAPQRQRCLDFIEHDCFAHRTLQQMMETYTPEWRLDPFRNPREALDEVTSDPPNAAVVERSIGVVPPLEFVFELKSRIPGLPVVIVMPCPESQAVLDALMAGACGVLYKPIRPRPLLHVLEALSRGKPALCPDTQIALLAALDPKRARAKSFTPRERQVIEPFLHGKSYKQISEHI